MTIHELETKSILILGFGTEGQATYDFLRKRWPSKPLAIADQRTTLSDRLKSDANTVLHLGTTYLDSLASCEVIIKTPGIPASMPPIAEARKKGWLLTSHSQIFLTNYPREKIIGVTGTKGKSTTASLLYDMLKAGGLPAELVGNIGQPPLARVDEAAAGSWFVHEFSSHQLAEVEASPHIAVLLNIVPEHLDYYASFQEYVAAKENITKYQTTEDFLVFNPKHAVPNAIAARTKAALRPMDMTKDWLRVDDSPLPGKFNLQNIMAAATAAALCGVKPDAIRAAVKHFRPLPHRLQLVGTHKGITFYDDSIATVPDATLAALDALGPKVQTLLLGGHERHLDFSDLARQLPSNVRTVILFPTTGRRIWDAIEALSTNRPLPEPFFVNSMEEAIRIAYSRTDAGGTCLLSPASPSFGMFKDYRERGEAFQEFIKTLADEQ